IAYSSVTKIAAISNGVAITHGNTTDEFTFFESFGFKDGPTLTLAELLNAPAISGVAPTATYTELSSAITLASGLTLNDLDNTTLDSATVSISNGFLIGDVLSVAGVTNGSSNE